MNKPWFLIYTENFKTITKARKREKQLKKWKNHKRIQKLIEHNQK